MTELTGPIVFKSGDEKRIASAAVLVPGEPDSDREILTPEKIEEVAHGWMEAYRNIDIQHSLVNIAIPVESYILPMDLPVILEGKKTSLPKGTWILTSRIPDPIIWEKVKSGDLTGYSVMGVSRATLNAILASGKSQETPTVLKRTLLADLGDDWVANFVSIVDRPAVPKAKWFALKVSDSDDAKEKSESRKPIVAAEKSGRRFSALTYALLKKAAEALVNLITEAEREREEKSKQKSAGPMLELTFPRKIMAEKNESGTPGASETPGNSTVKMDTYGTQYLIQQAIQAELQPIVDKMTLQVQDKINTSIKEAIQPVTDAIGKLEAGQATLSADHAKAIEAMKAEVDQVKKSAEALKQEMAETVIKAIEDRFGKKSVGTSNVLKGQDGVDPGKKDPAVKGENRDSMGRSLPAK